MASEEFYEPEENTYTANRTQATPQHATSSRNRQPPPKPKPKPALPSPRSTGVQSGKGTRRPFVPRESSTETSPPTTPDTRHSRQQAQPPSPQPQAESSRATIVPDWRNLNSFTSNVEDTPPAPASPVSTTLRMASRSSVDVSGVRQAERKSRGRNQMSQASSYPNVQDLGLIDSQRKQSLGVERPMLESRTPDSMLTPMLDESDITPKYPIIYKLTASDIQTKAQVTRYSTSPFKGLYDKRAEARSRLSAIDILQSVDGQGLAKKKNQTREDLGTDKFQDDGPFKVGEHIFSRSHPRPIFRIMYPKLLGLLKQVIQYYPGFDFAIVEKEATIDEPYRTLVHYYKELLGIVDSAKNGVPYSLTHQILGPLSDVKYDEITADYLSYLLNCFEFQKPYRESVLPELALHKKKQASYKQLWLLYKPGNIVLAKISKLLSAFIVSKAQRSEHSAKRSCWTISVWNLIFNGEKLIRQAHEFRVYQFAGNRDILTLPLWPIEFEPNSEKIKADLREQGRKYFEIACEGCAHRYYNGGMVDSKQIHYNGDIVIDPQSYVAHVQSSKQQAVKDLIHISSSKSELGTPNFFVEPTDFGGEPLWSQWNDRECTRERPLLSAQYVLCSRYVLGYALGKKEWGVFDMALVEKVESVMRSMDKLILEDKKKQLLLALTDRVRGKSLAPWPPDFIKGKGEGMVVLLYGAPGTGKTMTVECVAGHTKRPLLSLSAADLGFEEVQLEEKLHFWLAQATLWGAIILIDEAEVYLESRGRRDSKRNALVTVFLRTLEYYPGMLFLTTNNPGHIDEAIRSRLTVMVEYKPPDQDLRNQIWRNFIDKLVDDQKRRTDSGVAFEENPIIKLREGFETEAKAFASERFAMNGRDIRNALNTAITIARYEAVEIARECGKDRISEFELNESHIKKALANLAEFEKYQFSIDEASREDVALRESKRATVTSGSN